MPFVGMLQISTPTENVEDDYGSLMLTTSRNVSGKGTLLEPKSEVSQALHRAPNGNWTRSAPEVTERQ